MSDGSGDGKKDPMLDNLSKCLDMDCVKRAGGDMAQNAVEAAGKARDAVEDFGTRFKSDFVPRAQAATEAVSRAVTSDGTISEKVSQASEGVKSAMNTTKKKCPVRHPWLLTIVLAGAAAAAGFILYSRSRPVEDPWAEESWEDIDDDDLVVVTE